MLIFTCKVVMKAVAAVHRKLVRVDEAKWGAVVKVVASLASFPFFWLHNALFEFVYRVQDRKLRAVMGSSPVLDVVHRAKQAAGSRNPQDIEAAIIHLKRAGF
jgi:hypothetical protein